MHAFRYRYKAIGIYWAERLYLDFEASSTEIDSMGDNISYVLKNFKQCSNYIQIKDEIKQQFIRIKLYAREDDVTYLECNTS